MRFGKIDYLNLAPFDVFIKSYPSTSGFKYFINLRKSYPAKLNSDFLLGRIDAGFISSIAGYKSHLKNSATMSGIIAKGAVWSVIVMPKNDKSDYQSATSNALCKVLGLNGEVLIGDRALKYRYNKGEHLDMGELRARFDTPEQLLGWLAHRSGLTPDSAPRSAEELAGIFTWDALRAHHNDIVMASHKIG